MNLSPNALSEAILAIRCEYLALGVTPYDVGNGRCSDFVDDVLDRAIGAEWRWKEGQFNWMTLSSEELHKPRPGADTTVDAEGWDWDLLERSWSIRVPVAERARHDAIVSENASHMWIALDGRHYDCEHPEGVPSFFELNFFRRWLGKPAVSA